MHTGDSSKRMLLESDFFTIDKAQYIKIVIAHYVKIKLKYFLILYSVLISYNILLLVIETKIISALYVFLAISYSIPVIIIIYGILSLTRYLKSSQSHFITADKMIRLTDNSFYIIFRDGKYNEIPWVDCYTIKYNKNYIILFINTFFPILIPFKAFKAEKKDEIKNFIDEFTRNRPL